MSLRSSLLPLLVLLSLVQPPQQETIRQHYEAAEAQRRAGNLAGAETEYTAILAEGYSQLGKIYAAEKDYRLAIQTLETATRYAPRDESVLVELAIAYFETDQYQKAFAPLSKALALNSQSTAAHHMLGKTHFMLGEFRESTSELETALKLSPNDYDIAYTLGLAYLKQHELAPAKQIYDRMLAQLGDRPQLHIVFGRAYRETGFLAEALDEFKRAVALDPHFPRAHYYLGLTYLLKDGAVRLDDAAAEFKIELNSNPNEFFANYYLGVVYVIQRKWDLAIGLLQKASQIEPNNPDPYFHLGQAYQSVEKHEQAIEVLRKSIALNPELSHNDYQVTTAHYRLGQSLLKAGHKDEGEKELQLAADLKSKSLARDKEKAEAYLTSANLHEQNSKFPELVSKEGLIAETDAPDAKTMKDLKTGASYYEQVIASAHNSIGLLRADQQDFRGAKEQFARAAMWNPQLEGIDFNLGLAAYKAELYKDAIAPLERELAAHHTNQQARQLLGLSYFMTDNYPKASQLLTEVVALKPNNVGLYYTLILSLIKQGKSEQASRAMQQMILMNGNAPQLHIVLGQAYYEQGATQKALDELKAALALDSKTLLAHFYSGLIYLKDGKFADAAREFEAELALNPTDLQAKYHLGFVLLAAQQQERGISVLREVVGLKPDFADARYELGKALLQQGNTKEAVENLEAAVRLAPDKSYIHYQLGRAYMAAGRTSEGESHLEIYRQLKDKERGQTTP